jgi:hypothetical protein
MEFTVIQGNIAAQEADVLVNAAGTSLQMGSGVAGALRRAAGEAINDSPRFAQRGLAGGTSRSHLFAGIPFRDSGVPARPSQKIRGMRQRGEDRRFNKDG